MIVDMNPTWNKPTLEIAQGLFNSEAKIEDFKNLIINKISTPALEEKESSGSLRQTMESRINLPNVDEVDGIVITGSPFSGALLKRDLTKFGIEKEGKGVFLPFWQKDLVEFIKEACEKDKPLLGICFGKEEIVEALGGKVQEMAKDEAGNRRKQIGYTRIYKTIEAETDPIFKTLPGSFVAIENHDRETAYVPEGSRILAVDALGSVQAFRIGKNVWGVQFHPEKTKEDAEKLLEKKENIGKFDPLEQDQLRQEFDQDVGQQILQNFTKQVFLNSY